ncbi:MAG: hypothetical protein H7334_12660 [Ferruginibacter sp.]|nr:hypothetical protein [Ferruginibacter sp.]
MHKKRNILIGLFILGILIFAGAGVYLYNKPRESAADKTAVVTLSAMALYKQYEANENAANQKYLGKVIEVQGSVSAISQQNGLAVLSLTTGNPASAINCQLFTSDKISAVKVGDAVAIKGKCTGFLMDVNLVDCALP